MITEEIILNFFEGKCDARDAAIVDAWLRENPAKLKEFIGEEEWENFQPANALSPDISGKLWDGIHIKTNAASPEVHYSYFRWTATAFRRAAVAASLLLVIGLSLLYFFKTQRAGIISSATVAKTTNIFNNTPQKMTLTLSDGSTVELLPNSTLHYPENFAASKREVKIDGEAYFNIAKDAARPFSVYSHSVLITVLGTRFSVNSFEANNTAKVILHEGSVMVTISNPADSQNKKEYFLTPGDIFVLRKANTLSPSSNLARITASKNISGDSLLHNSSDSLSARILHLEKDKEDGYAFDNYPLDVVFDQLQIIYNTRIIYNKAELGNRSFIGRIDKKDQLYNILKSIALLNHFGLHQQGDSIVISN